MVNLKEHIAHSIVQQTSQCKVGMFASLLPSVVPVYNPGNFANYRLKFKIDHAEHIYFLLYNGKIIVIYEIRLYPA